MVEKIDAGNTEKYSKSNLYLLILIDYIAKIKKNSSMFAAGVPYPNVIANESIAYLKYVNQYLKPLNTCLKKLKGLKKEEFTEDFKSTLQKSYRREIIKYADDLHYYAKNKINSNKTLQIDFTSLEINYSHFRSILFEKFKQYKSKCKPDKHPADLKKIVKINFSSDSIRNKVRGKMRNLAKYACINEALEIIEERINLTGQYKYKKLVKNLDELVQDFLIDSTTGNINEIIKDNNSLAELVNKAEKKYDVWGNTDYLLNKNSFKSALRSKFESVIKKNEKNS